MDYEWDEQKRNQNLIKHGLDFADADLVIESPFVMITDSPRGEQHRLQAFAYVFEALMVLTVVWVPVQGRCRVVSFRPARRTERVAYHEWLEKNFPDQP